MFAAVGTDGTRAVVWGVGATEAAALTDASSHDDGSFEIGDLETHEITAVQALIVQEGDVSWPIAAVITDLEWRDSADETVRGWWYTYDGVDCMLVDPMTWDANADRAEVLRSVAHHRRVDSVVER
jgi:hypothetical protein